MIYNILFFTFLLFSLTEIMMYNNSIVVKQRISVGIVICLFLIVFAGGRLNTGLDYAGYEQYFELAKQGSLKIVNTIVEPLYVVVNLLSPSFRVLLFVMAIGCVGIKYIAFKKLNVRLLAFVMLIYYASFFLSYDMGIMRQGLSMSICLLSIPYAEKKEKKFFIFVGIAALFHIGAVLFLVIYFVADRKLSRRTYYALLGASILISIIASSNVIQNGIVGRVISLIGGGYVNYKYDRYFSTETSNILYTVLKRVLIGVVFVEWFNKKTTLEDQEGIVWTYINGYVISVIAFASLNLIGFAALSGRMTACLYMLYCLVYEKIISSKQKHLMRIALLILFIVLSYSTLNEIVVNSSGNLYQNYSFFLSSN